jgi:hypothetical protein
MVLVDSVMAIGLLSMVCGVRSVSGREDVAIQAKHTACLAQSVNPRPAPPLDRCRCPRLPGPVFAEVVCDNRLDDAGVSASEITLDIVPSFVLSATRSSNSVLLRRGALDVLRPRTLRAVGNLELDSITLAQICDALAIDSALVKEVFLPRLTLDEPKAFVHSQRPNCPHHVSISDLWFLTIAVEFNSNDGMTCLVDLTRRRAPVAE